MIDVVVTMVIVVILASIAYPSYVSQMRRAHRSEAASELASLAQAQERFYARFRTYSSVIAGPDGCEDMACGLQHTSGLTENEFYVLSADADARSYTLKATAHGVQLKDAECRVMTVDNVGIKSAFSAEGQDVTDTCW